MDQFFLVGESALKGRVVEDAGAGSWEDNERMSREGGDEKGEAEEEDDVAWTICLVERVRGHGSPTNGATRWTTSSSRIESDLQERAMYQ